MACALEETKVTGPENLGAGLTSAEALRRIRETGPNIYGEPFGGFFFRELLSNFFNPLNIVLGFICLISYFVGEKINALIVFIIISISSSLSFFQEHRSLNEAKKLSEAVKSKTAVMRDGAEMEIPAPEVVPGDLVILRAGDMVPADLKLLSAKDLFVDESALTGESLPVEKYVHGAENGSGQNILVYAGSSVVSGAATGYVIATGKKTEYGALVAKISEAPVETAFDRGIKRFVWLMIGFTAFLVTFIFLMNVIVKGRAIEALLFSLAVTVGLTPEMLPVIIAITLSVGAVAMSKRKVIVKHLNAIQNLGAMDVICSDKTGTLTENRIVLEKHCDVIGRGDVEVLRLAYLNSHYQTGLKNILDEAVLRHEAVDLHGFHKFDEIPFDFERRLMSVVIEVGDKHRLIAKGAPEAVMDRSTHYELDQEIHDLTPDILNDLKKEHEALSAQGFRVLAVAYKDYPERLSVYSKAEENNLVLKGYLAFLDPPKPDAQEIIRRLEGLGVRFLVLTGDDELITKHICDSVGLNADRVITGKMLANLNEKEVLRLLQTESIFARLSPSQKEKIVLLLRRQGHTVGYLGDGINDAPSLKAADIGISVDNAVDVSKESADLILLEKSLLVLENGIVEGRKISGNVMKYLRMAASSNLGNMISMTTASLFLPFLPMTPVQILINNLLYDLSQVAIPGDKLDEDFVRKPRPWNFSSLIQFMAVFGLLSSFFDFLTFGVMFFLLRFSENMFHTGWFLESLATQTLVIHVIRSKKIPWLQTRSSKLLLFTSVATLCMGFALTVSPLNHALGFNQMPGLYYGILGGIVLAYLVIVEMTKRGCVTKLNWD